MKHLIHKFCMSVTFFIAHTVGHQNVPEWSPPGVPPSHYQQQNVPMQHMPPQQQIPVQHVQHQQHMPVQHQGPPIQQQPIMQQQIPMQGHHHDGQPQVLNVANIAQEKQHIQEHLSVPIDTSKMTEQELQFHYFKMHDADNNNKLDGCELIKSLIHWHEQGHAEHGKPAGNNDKLFKDEELVSLIDPILALDDANNDGYIDYPEFVKAQQKAAAAQQQQPPQQRH